MKRRLVRTRRRGRVPAVGQAEYRSAVRRTVVVLSDEVITLLPMAWCNGVEYGEIREMTAEETAAFDAEVAYAERVSALRRKYADRRVRRASFQPPRDAQGKVITEAFNRMDIYTRDEGICQLCLDPVDLMLAWPDPAALTIDHVDRHGPHTRANCRLSHNFCNNDAQWAEGCDADLARARLKYKLATNEKAGPGDRFPRRSPLTGDVVGHEEWRRHASPALVNTRTDRVPARTTVRTVRNWLRAVVRRVRFPTVPSGRASRRYRISVVREGGLGSR